MKILVIAHYQNGRSIIAPYIRDQLRAYIELGNQVLVLSPIAFGKKDHRGKRFGPLCWIEEIDGVDYAFVRFLSFSRYGEFGANTWNAVFSAWLFLLKYIKAFNPAVIHANTLGFDSEIGAWLKKKIACPLVVTTHGSDAAIPLQKGKSDRLRIWINRTDALVCVSEKIKKSLEFVHAKPEILVIHNGFNNKWLQKNSTPKKKNSIIQVCNLLPSKRVNDTIKAFAIVKEQYPDAFLTIIGQGPGKKTLIKLCEELDLTDSVIFTGQIDNDKVLERLSESEYFVMVSSPEGFGIVYLEAMASKCLTIGAENEGIADLIRSGENGILLPVDRPDKIADTLLWAIGHPEESKRIVQRGYECAVDFTWENNAKQYLTLFDTLFNRLVP